MAEAMARRPIDDAHGVGLGDPGQQHLARFVPVDQEDERSADRFKKGVALDVIFGLKTAGNEIEHATIAEPLRALAVEPAPLHGKFAVHAGEELGARQMHIGVGDRHDVIFDADHHHMRFGLADVVLDGETVAGSRGGRREPGMTEFQFARRADPAHEGLDRGAVLWLEPMHVGTRQHLFRMLHGQAVQRLVQIHHQPVQAVAAGARDSGQPGDVRQLQCVGSLRCRFLLHGGQARCGPSAFSRVRGLDRLDHMGDVVPDRSLQTAKAGRRHAIARQARAIDQRLQRHRIEAGGAALIGEIEASAMRLARTTRRRLQNAQADLHPIIRRQSLGDQRR